MKQIFINLPVKNVEASMNFYKELGFTVNPLFTFDEQKCMVWSEQVFVMLQTWEMSRKGIDKALADPSTSSIATFTLPVESLSIVNDMMERGLRAGGSEPTKFRDEGFMQIRNIEDPDGHHWGIMYLDLEKFKEVTGK